MKTASVAQTKDRLPELLREVERGAPVAVSRRGEVVAVLVAADEYERLRGAAAASDFAAWLGGWRSRAGAPFEGISADELARWSAES